MTEMDEIYAALIDGKRAAEALATWVSNADGRDLVRSRLRTIESGISAYERLSAQLRDGRKHVQTPEDWKPTACMCSWPNASPPCSWCTDPENHAEEELPANPEAAL